MVSEAAAAAPSLRNVRRERDASSVMTGSFRRSGIGLKNLMFARACPQVVAVMALSLSCLSLI
jgi:hypothetical protein